VGHIRVADVHGTNFLVNPDAVLFMRESVGDGRRKKPGTFTDIVMVNKTGIRVPGTIEEVIVNLHWPVQQNSEEADEQS